MSSEPLKGRAERVPHLEEQLDALVVARVHEPVQRHHRERVLACDKEVLSARGLKRLGRHSDYSRRAAERRPGRGPGVQVGPVKPRLPHPWCVPIARVLTLAPASSSSFVPSGLPAKEPCCHYDWWLAVTRA